MRFAVLAAFLLPTALLGAEPSKFAIPVWHADARWQIEDPFSGSAAPGFLDGPRLESQPFAGKVGLLYGPTNGGRNLLLSYDARTETVHTGAGSARGFLDGPFSRARFGVSNYNARPRWAHSPDRRYSYMTDVANQHALRRFDIEKQVVKTIRHPIKGFGGLAIDDKGTLLLVEGENLLWLDSEGKEQKRLKLTLEESITGIGGAGASLAHDEVHGRLYASGYSPKKWYVFYWDLENGFFHGVLPVSEKGAGRKKNEAGPFVGTTLYAEGSIGFGPDDPGKRFLYTARIDTWSFFRLDLDRKHIASLSAVHEKGKPPVAMFIDAGTPSTVPVYGKADFTEDGSILSSRHSPFVATRLLRIK